jgi:signal transduction histidine kinase/streptogramin lyase
VGTQVVLINLAALLILQIGIPAFALNGDRPLRQYVHTTWGADKGYLSGTVYAIAQSADGYLWLGTEHGLVRFDGFGFTLIEHPLPNRVPLGAVRGLVEDNQGNLWIRLNGPRLLRYRNGTFEDAASKFNVSDVSFTAMSRSYGGNLLLWGPQHKTLRFQDGRFRNIVPRDKIDGLVVSIMESSNGVMWLGTRGAGLYRIQDGQITEVLSETGMLIVNAMAPSEHGGVWIGSETGLHLWEQGEPVRLKLPEGLRKAQVLALLRDRNHALWVGTDVGLYRIDPELRVVTGFYRGAEETEVSAIYQDNEGDIWFAGSHGIDRLRNGMFTSFSSTETSLKEIGGPIFVDGDRRTWFAPISGGLYCLENDRVRRVGVPGLGNDVIYSIDGTKDELWLGRQEGGLTELTRRDDKWLTKTFTQKDGLAQNSVYTVTRARDGSVWAGTVSGGVSVLRHSQFKTYTVNNGLPSNAIFSSMEADDHKMWFASPSGLLSFDGNHWTTYAAPDTDPPPNVRTVFEDSGHVLWVGTSHGLTWFDHRRIEVPHDLPQALDQEVLSIGQDAEGFLWVATAQHVLQIDRAKLLSGTLKENDVLSYGADDGLTETEGVRRDRSLVADLSGRIWLSLSHSLAVADVRAAEGYRRPVGVRVDSVLPEGGSSEGRQGFELPSETRSITFRYSGTNLSIPQRTQFRYLLGGLEQTWSSDASLRQVAYTHLSPGSYTFRIMASNALGVWNGPETEVTFKIQPAFWETWYFRLLCVIVGAAVAIALYRIRLTQVTEQLNRRFQDRLAERTRIAQDLHDTLLQGVISASMQLDVAQDRLSEDSPAKPMLGRVLQLMRQVTEEGREALRGLRTIDSSVSLEATFKRLANELVHTPASGYVIHVQGYPRPLQSAVLDEVYRIGREAYINAAAHAQAARIEITIEYGLRDFRLLVRDDGCGINAQILKDGRHGHWGLAGMRERAQAIGSVLKIRSRVPGGTDVELVVAAAIAYPRTVSHRIRWPWRPRAEYSEPQEKTRPPQ